MPANAVNARFVRVQSTNTTPHRDSVVNLNALIAMYDGNPYSPVNGTVSPYAIEPTGVYNWPSVVVDDRRISHTAGTGPAGSEYIEIDLGQDRPIDRVDVYNRPDLPWNERIVNYTLRLYLSDRTEVHSCAFDRQTYPSVVRFLLPGCASAPSR